MPLLFAGDINVYSVARAFHEAYGCVSKVYGKYNTGPCTNSAIIDYTANEEADRSDTFFELVSSFAARNNDKKVILLGCGDSYVELAAYHKNSLPKNVTAPYIDRELMRSLINKERFYELCEKSGIDYPETFVYRREMGKLNSLPFAGPFIIKPSSGIEYWRHPFTTQKKVYKEESIEAVNSVLDDIYGAGYTDSVIIQDFIPGDDSFMRVLTSYSDRNGRPVMFCLGHVLLEEHTPHGIGNHALILTDYDKELTEKFRRLLENLDYTGFANFDIKYDSRDGKFKVFEINTRQGRSNYYVTASGANIARLIVSDRIDEEDMDLIIAREEILWTVIPKAVACKYVNEDYLERIRTLAKNGRMINPLLYDAEKDPRKLLALAKNLAGHHMKYKKYLGAKK